MFLIFLFFVFVWSGVFFSFFGGIFFWSLVDWGIEIQQTLMSSITKALKS